MKSKGISVGYACDDESKKLKLKVRDLVRIQGTKRITPQTYWI